MPFSGTYSRMHCEQLAGSAAGTFDAELQLAQQLQLHTLAQSQASLPAPHEQPQSQPVAQKQLEQSHTSPHWHKAPAQHSTAAEMNLNMNQLLRFQRSDEKLPAAI